MIHSRYIMAATILSLMLTLEATAQKIDSYETYMQRVASCNASYLAERYNVEIAQASYAASKVFNDPEIEIAYTDNQDNTLMMGRSFEATLGYEVSLAGVRRQRIAVARDERDISKAELEDYFTTLRQEAAQAWANAWQAIQLEGLRRSSYESMQMIAQADSLRLEVGEINATDAMKTSLEAQAAFNEWAVSQAACNTALAALRIYTGGEEVIEVNELPAILFETLDLHDLKEIAKENRADLRSAQLTAQLSRDNLKLVKASRGPEVGLSLGYAYNTEVRNEIAPAPAFRGLTVGATIPLKFSSLYKGEKVAAAAAVSQSDALLDAALNAIDIEVEQAYVNYVCSKAVLDAFSTDILAKSEQILHNCTYGYSEGESGLLELIDARREHNDLFESYIEACTSAFTTAVALKRAIGR